MPAVTRESPLAQIDIDIDEPNFPIPIHHVLATNESISIRLEHCTANVSNSYATCVDEMSILGLTQGPIYIDHEKRNNKKHAIHFNEVNPPRCRLYTATQIRCARHTERAEVNPPPSSGEAHFKGTPIAMRLSMSLMAAGKAGNEKGKDNRNDNENYRNPDDEVTGDIVEFVDVLRKEAKGRRKPPNSLPKEKLNADPKGTTVNRDLVKGILRKLRDRHTVGHTKEKFLTASTSPAYTVFENATGGGLDTMAAGLAGFRHTGGTEDVDTPLGHVKGEMFEDMTLGAKCWGSVRRWTEFIGEYKQLYPLLNYMKTGMPCTNHAALGDQSGSDGIKGGDLFLLQVPQILAMLPDIFRIEFVPNALNVPKYDRGRDVRLVMVGLRPQYRLFVKMINVWELGDPTHRQRIFIVGLRRYTVPGTVNFHWPQEIFGDLVHPVARDIAVPDAEVPECYKRFGKIDLVAPHPNPIPGKLLTIGYNNNTGVDTRRFRSGLSFNPTRVDSWEGNFATGQTTNGGAVRPPLDWRPGQPLNEVRLGLIAEWLRGASLDEFSYLEWSTRFLDTDATDQLRDQFIRELVNMGVPLCTSLAIDHSVMATLMEAGINPSPPDMPLESSVQLLDPNNEDPLLNRDDVFEAHFAGEVLVGSADSALVCTDAQLTALTGIADSGCTELLMHNSINHLLTNSKQSNICFKTAEAKFFKADRSGRLALTVMNVEAQPSCDDWVDLNWDVVTASMGNQNLWGLAPLYHKEELNVSLQHPGVHGSFTGLWRDKSRHKPALRVPMSTLPDGKGWTVVYIIRDPGHDDDTHRARVRETLRFEREKREIVTNDYPEYNANQASTVMSYHWACTAVTQQLTQRVEGERDIRPAFTYGGSKRLKAASWKTRHHDHGHLGEPHAPCVICDMFKGPAMRVPKHTYGRPREHRPGYLWYMDLMTFRHRSEEGSKHLLGLTEGGPSGAVQLIPIVFKSDLVYEIHRWIVLLRSHPAFVDIHYALISVIITDNESVWSEEAKDFRIMLSSIATNWADLRTGTAQDTAQYQGMDGGTIIPGKGVVWAPVRPADEDRVAYPAHGNPQTGVMPEVIRGPPELHATFNARQEGSNKIVQAGIQSMQYERNLPPSWWQRLASDCMFLLNRHPLLSLDGHVPHGGGDRASPIEILFLGWISRYQVYRELDCYVGCGQPALVRVRSTKGSDLEPSCRWGICLSRKGKVTLWLCPYTDSRFRSRTYTAYTLRDGLNSWQFLGLPSPVPHKQARTLRNDAEEEKGRDKWILALREPQVQLLTLPAPVSEVIMAFGNSTLDTIRAKARKQGKDLCQFFPSLKRVKEDGTEVYDRGDEESDTNSQVDGEGSKDLEPTIQVTDHNGVKLPVMSPSQCRDEPVDRGLDLDQSTHIDGVDEDQTLPVEGNYRKRKASPALADGTLPTSKRTKSNLSTTGAKKNDKNSKVLDTINKRKDTPPVKSGRKKKPTHVRFTDDATNIPVDPPGVEFGSTLPGQKYDKTVHPSEFDLMDCGIDIFTDPETQEKIDVAEEREAKREESEALQYRKYGITTCGHHPWSYFCKAMHNKLGMLPVDKRNLYRIWLLTKTQRDGEEPIYVEDLPRKECDSSRPIKEGLFLPYPSGPHWERLLADNQYSSTHKELINDEELEEEAAYYCRAVYEQAVSNGAPKIQQLGIAMLSKSISEEEVQLMFAALNTNIMTDLVNEISSDGSATDRHATALCAWGAAMSSMEEGRPPDPKTVVAALLQADAEDWARALHKEMDGLDDQGVFSHGHTMAEIRAQGIRGKPIPCSVALTYKYKDGLLEKLKARICLAGHKGNVTQGIHYTDVFAAAPVEHTEKVLQTMMVQFHLERKAWDVKMAYTWAPLQVGQKVAVLYPEGFKRPPKPPLTPGGPPQEVFMILEKNLYGMPSAGRGWSQHRNKFVHTRFNPGSGTPDSGQWTCHRTIADPCLWVIDRVVDPSLRKGPRDPLHGDTDLNRALFDTPRTCLNLPDNIERSWVLVHTDDCDGYGTSLEVLSEIMQIMHEEWTVEEVDSEVILGVKRTLDRSNPDSWHVTLTMVPYMENLIVLWESHIIEEFGANWATKVRKTAWPDGVKLSKIDPTSPEEQQRNLKRGYMSLVGGVLWAVRHCFPMALNGCSQMCKLMSVPTDRAFRSGLHLLIYMYQHRHEGIRFSETASTLRAHCDASNDADWDGKCKYGFVIYWGGPLISKSSKLAHVGLNSTYNEYQALTHCIKHVVWLRKLLVEMKLKHITEQALPILADNVQANNLCKEDIVTKGNMYINVTYHYNKEQVNAGEVDIFYINTHSNTSDPYTKGLGPVKEEGFRPALCGYDRRVYEHPVRRLGGNRWDVQ